MPGEGDVVLIYYNNQPSVFGRIEYIEPDIKKDWYRVTFLLFTLPTQGVTWILRESYINGDPFTMGGTPMRLEEVKKIPVPEKPEGEGKTGDKSSPDIPGKVIPFKKK